MPDTLFRFVDTAERGSFKVSPSDEFHSVFSAGVPVGFLGFEIREVDRAPESLQTAGIADAAAEPGLAYGERWARARAVGNLSSVQLVGKRTCDKLKWSPLHCDVHVAEAHGAAPLVPREEWPDEAIAAVAAYPRWFHWFALMWRQLLVFQAK